MPKIEGYMFEEHEMIRLAATECMCNLALSPEVSRGLARSVVAAAAAVMALGVAPSLTCCLCAGWRTVSGERQ